MLLSVKFVYARQNFKMVLSEDVNVLTSTYEDASVSQHLLERLVSSLCGAAALSVGVIARGEFDPLATCTIHLTYFSAPVEG